MPQLEVLVLELPAVDRLAAGAVALGEVPAPRAVFRSSRSARNPRLLAVFRVGSLSDLFSANGGI